MKKLLIFVLIFVLFACKNSKKDVDVSNINIELKMNRFDKDLFSFKPDSINNHVLELYQKYGRFMDLYSQKIISIGGLENADYAYKLREFMFYCKTNGIVSKIDAIFPTTDTIKKELTEAFKHYKYYFPEKQIPNVYTYISAFNQSTAIDENILGIGLDKYLGEKCEFYDRLGWDKYLRKKMHKKMITVDCMRGMAVSDFPDVDSTNNLVCSMIYEGKIQYYIDAMLPKVADSLKWGYSDGQLKWAEKYEHKVWAFLIEKKQLFITDAVEIRKYTGDSPFTVIFGNVSAPRLGAWVGWKIVKSYMEKNPQVTLPQLMKDKNYQKILNYSKYNP